MLHLPNECGHTASVPQESIGVQNVLDTIWHVPKTIFQHQAEFSRSKTQKKWLANDHPRPFIVTTYLKSSLKSSFSRL